MSLSCKSSNNQKYSQTRYRRKVISMYDEESTTNDTERLIHERYDIKISNSTIS